MDFGSRVSPPAEAGELAGLRHHPY